MMNKTIKSTHTLYEFPELDIAENEIRAPIYGNTTKYKLFPEYLEALYNYNTEGEEIKSKITLLRNKISTISLDKDEFNWVLCIIISNDHMISNAFENYIDADNLRKDILEWLISS